MPGSKLVISTIRLQNSVAAGGKRQGMNSGYSTAAACQRCWWRTMFWCTNHQQRAAGKMKNSWLGLGEGEIRVHPEW